MLSLLKNLFTITNLELSNKIRLSQQERFYNVEFSEKTFPNQIIIY